MLFSRQSTLDDLDGPETVPKTSERARPGLRKMLSMDVSSSSAESASLASRCSHVHALSVTVSPPPWVIAQMSSCDLCVFVNFYFKNVHD